MTIRADILAMPWDLYGLKPHHIAGAPDDFWVTCVASAEVVHLLPDRAVKHFPTDGAPERVALGGERVWYTMPFIQAIGHLDSDGSMATYDLGSTPGHLIADAEGATVDTDAGPKHVANDGTVAAAPAAPTPFGVTVTEFDDHSGRIRDALYQASEIADDGEGGCWFTQTEDDLLGHLDANFTVTEYDLSEYGERPRGLLVDSEGFPWVVLQTGGVIGVIPEDSEPAQPQII